MCIRDSRNTREPGEEIITAQKAIAKVTITRSKENADALMNSNDRVVDNLLQLKESMDAGFEQFAGKQQNMMDDSVKMCIRDRFQVEASSVAHGHAVVQTSHCGVMRRPAGPSAVMMFGTPYSGRLP